MELATGFMRQFRMFIYRILLLLLVVIMVIGFESVTEGLDLIVRMPLFVAFFVGGGYLLYTVDCMIAEKVKRTRK